MEYKFNKFDLNIDPPCDHFFVNGGSKKPIQLQPNLCKRINKEWNILQTSLPDSIFVRAFESRIDLLRAVIIGSNDTPYSNGLFFFDIKFPPFYPLDPPIFIYHPRPGFYMNPNFHSNGIVCLSILNNWVGYNQEEQWNPEKSTILQILVSIQGLVLNQYPYLNDPNSEHLFTSVEKQRFNRNCVWRTHKSMTYVLKNPPEQFEDLVAEHFRVKGNNILQDYKNQVSSDTTKGLFMDLAKAFEENGSDCRKEVDEVKRLKKRKGSGFIKIIDTLMFLMCCDFCFEFMFSEP